MKSAYKYELAEAAGVNYKTFQRWMANNRTILSRFGVRRNSKMLPPRAVQWICLQYGIDFQRIAHNGDVGRYTWLHSYVT